MHLVNLDIESYKPLSFPLLLMDLQHLKWLETLKYDEIADLKTEEKIDDWQNFSVSCAIKKLSLLLCARPETLVAFGDLMKFSLKSCPLLEMFHTNTIINGCKQPWPVLDLRFYDNPLLKEISLSMNNDYCSFSDIPERQGKVYKRDGKTIGNGEILARGSNYIINLAWK